MVAATLSGPAKTVAALESAKSKKAAAKEAKRVKRYARLLDVCKEKGELAFRVRLGQREAKHFQLATDWKSFCLMKASAWTELSAKPPVENAKKLAKKEAKRAKLAAALAALDAELGIK